VIFALKVLTTHEEPYIRAMLLGVEIPGKYAAWVELIVIHMLVPNSSFMGHFAGILAGIIYCKSFLGPLLDKLLYCITGDQVVHGTDLYYIAALDDDRYLKSTASKKSDTAKAYGYNTSVSAFLDESMSRYPYN
ncbi:hypothetical protein RUM43_009582, partial [Polyplax serrata]